MFLTDIPPIPSGPSETVPPTTGRRTCPQVAVWTGRASWLPWNGADVFTSCHLGSLCSLLSFCQGNKLRDRRVIVSRCDLLTQPVFSIASLSLDQRLSMPCLRASSTVIYWWLSHSLSVFYVNASLSLVQGNSMQEIMGFEHVLSIFSKTRS